MDVKFGSINSFDDLTSNSLESDADRLSDSSSDIAASDDDLDSLREFCFETPRLAYKANNDYKELLQAIVLWKSQRAQAKRDKQTLLKYQEEALTHSFQFLDDMQDKKIELPPLQKIAPLPNVDFNKYNISDFSLEKSIRSRCSSVEQTEEENENSNSSKPNQFWSEAEQKRLEALLLIYPPEEVEARRWEKIASALGSRTPRQVASRVQKYFMKLARAGSSVPGRAPNRAALNKQKKRSRMRYSNYALAGSKVKIDYEEIEVSDEEDIPIELRNTPEYQELILIKKVLKRKRNTPKLEQL